MKSIWNEDPTELLGLEEEGATFDLAGAEDDEDAGVDESLDLSGFDDEEDPNDYGEDEDEYDEEDTSEVPELGPRSRGAGVAVGLRARRRARLLGMAALRNRKRARLLGIAAIRLRRRTRIVGTAAIVAKMRSAG